LIVGRINEGILDDNLSLETISDQFELTTRQIRRIVRKELGVTPIELIQSYRLLMSKQLLTETSLSVTEIAFASGFSSLRRFNDAFSGRYKMPPTRLRKEAKGQIEHIPSDDTSTIQLVYRPPYDWTGVLEFLRLRTLKGVEWVTEDGYWRTVHLGEHRGWISVRHAPEKNALLFEFSHSLTPILAPLIGRIRGLFDVNARPDLIAQQLRKEPLLKKSVNKNKGLRVPGAFDSFELAVRAILGQQVTVKAATTLAGRFVDAFGEKIDTPFPELTRVSPTPKRLAKATVDDIASLGIVSARAKCIIAIAKAFDSGELHLTTGEHPDDVIKQLVALPGIGPWTAHYIAMRALRWPDAFPKEDIVIRNKLGGISAKQADERSQAWRPWRSYAVLHLWRL
jgi:AraC family transcriptional regulator of adaptative response / DNA-3-methyladenine glycosylase II